ncbi:unnamed protein product [Heligmosomoides polygyrus]|uniref:DUF2946 domain-containing protein n=1 Tax=Heligmosomoides polygyrus TaxID=6339 RepID=A0A183GT21_HELPZ|nr:unnamed protein product [Heligmosomoides polygyrus]
MAHDDRCQMLSAAMNDLCWQASDSTLTSLSGMLLFIWLAMSSAIAVVQLLVTTQPEWIVSRDQIQVNSRCFECLNFHVVSFFLHQIVRQLRCRGMPR